MEIRSIHMLYSRKKLFLKEARLSSNYPLIKARSIANKLAAEYQTLNTQSKKFPHLKFLSNFTFGPFRPYKMVSFSRNLGFRLGFQFYFNFEFRIQ